MPTSIQPHPAASPKPDILPLGNYGDRICPQGYKPEGNAHTGYVRCESQDYIDRGAWSAVAAPVGMIAAPFAVGAAIDSGVSAYASTAAREYGSGIVENLRGALQTFRDPKLLGRALADGTHDAIKEALPAAAAITLGKAVAGHVIDWAKQRLGFGNGASQ